VAWLAAPALTLPTAKDVVARFAINPNTVLKAYRELEHVGLANARPGVGTFITATLSDASLAAHGPLRKELQRWIAKARLVRLDDESIEALFDATFTPPLSPRSREHGPAGHRPG
jgi:GntR family transcriptional regulator